MCACAFEFGVCTCACACVSSMFFDVNRPLMTLLGKCMREMLAQKHVPSSNESDGGDKRRPVP